MQFLKEAVLSHPIVSASAQAVAGQRKSELHNVMCQAYRLAEVYLLALCLCLGSNEAAAFESGPCYQMTAHAFMDQVCLSSQPDTGWSAWPVLLRGSAQARWYLQVLRWEQKQKEN